LLVIIYHVLKTKKPYTELGEEYFDQLEKTYIERRSVRRLESVNGSPFQRMHSFAPFTNFIARHKARTQQREAAQAPSPELEPLAASLTSFKAVT
jgi:hypothetical protein